MSLAFPRRRLDQLQDLAARVLDVRRAGDRDALARDLLLGFIEVCMRTGLDGVLEALGADVTDPYAFADKPGLQAAVVEQLAKQFEEGGPRNAMPRKLVDCVLAALGLTVVDQPDRTIPLSGELRAAMIDALTKVIDLELAPERLKANIIADARARCAPHYHGAFERIAASLDERGLSVLKQPKLPLDAVQAVQKTLSAARDAVIGRAARAAIDRAKSVLAEGNAEAAARIDEPLTLRLTPRDVAVHRVTEARASRATAAVVQSVFDSLTTFADLSYRAAERTARPYGASQTFAVGELIEHPKFGQGTVTAVAVTRIDVEFADATRSLVHAKK
ncbi:MAG TPA: hypothetical protein VK427_07265 [Kofleriaceae bacterium]|nr:hypothetical protein [Kofleriaceae bacterium]